MASMVGAAFTCGGRVLGGKLLQFTLLAEAGPGECCLCVEAHLGSDTGGGLTKWFVCFDNVVIARRDVSPGAGNEIGPNVFSTLR